MLVLLADGGSTKIHWQLRLDDDVIHEFRSTGVNPAVMAEDMVGELMTAALHTGLATVALPEPLHEVRYYGAGCKGEACEVVRRVIGRALAQIGSADVAVIVGSDMLGTCAGLLGDNPGVSCILGTGANSCLYDGRAIVANTPPMGFILGDEGSGTWLGKRLLADRFKGLLPKTLAEAFDRRFRLTESEAIRKVYRPTDADGAPNRFLASLVPFISENISHPAMEAIVREGFQAFVSRNLMAYFDPGLLAACGVTDSRELRVCCSGGVAYAFRDILAEVLRANRLTPGIIAPSPFSRL